MNIGKTIMYKNYKTMRSESKPDQIEKGRHLFKVIINSLKEFSALDIESQAEVIHEDCWSKISEQYKIILANMNKLNSILSEENKIKL